MLLINFSHFWVRSKKGATERDDIIDEVHHLVLERLGELLVLLQDEPALVRPSCI